MALDIQELVRANKPIYVYNRASKYLNSASPYVLEMRDGNKRIAKVIIPATKYPFLLSGHVPAKLLAESTEFYAAVSKGILELVDPDKAKKIMENPTAQKVQEHALKKFQPVRRTANVPPEIMTNKNREDYRPAGADKGISGLPEQSRQSSTPLVVAETRGEGASGPGDVNASVLQIVMDLKSDKNLYEEKWLELDGMENLTDLDYGYLLNNCKEFPKILQLARTELANLVGDDTAAELEEEREIEEAAPTGKRRGRKRRKK
ncbi:hypothetical protein LCGC14_0723990 [marine sediment metagenome]|uniref:Uncharacterized protein n=1 Tax=marine sediment metagenome TaxID=412755 RepID=A0A0F9TIW5_9ZZZZ